MNIQELEERIDELEERVRQKMGLVELFVVVVCSVIGYVAVTYIFKLLF